MKDPFHIEWDAKENLFGCLFKTIPKIKRK
jgi:hypothetical protein